MPNGIEQMTTQTKEQREDAHIKDTLQLIRDVAEANQIPSSILTSAILTYLFEETAKNSASSVIGYIVKFQQLIDLFSKGSADWMIEQMKKGKLR